MKTTLLLLTALFLFTCTSTIGTRKSTTIDGVTNTETKERIVPCSLPEKRYEKDVSRALSAQLGDVPNLPYGEFETEIKKRVVELSEYSSKGLDLDLLMYRLCEITTNRGFSPEQTQEFYEAQSRIWFIALGDKEVALDDVKKSQQKIINQNVGIQTGVDGLKKSSNRDTEIQFKISNKYENLVEKYPYGFKVFGLRADGKIIDGDATDYPTIGITANWSNLKIDISNKRYNITLPELNYQTDSDKSLQLNAQFSKNETVIPLKPYSQEIALGGIQLLDEPAPFFEKLFSIEGVLTYVIGIKNVTQDDVEFYEKSGAFVNVEAHIENMTFPIRPKN